MSALDNPFPLTAVVFYGRPLTRALIACLHASKRSGIFGGGRLLSNQLEQFKKLSKTSNWLEKIRPSKKSASFLDMHTGFSHIQNEVGFLEGRLFSSQSELLKLLFKSELLKLL